MKKKIPKKKILKEKISKSEISSSTEKEVLQVSFTQNVCHKSVLETNNEVENKSSFDTFVEEHEERNKDEHYIKNGTLQNPREVQHPREVYHPIDVNAIQNQDAFIPGLNNEDLIKISTKKIGRHCDLNAYYRKKA